MLDWDGPAMARTALDRLVRDGPGAGGDGDGGDGDATEAAAGAGGPGVRRAGGLGAPAGAAAPMGERPTGDAGDPDAVAAADGAAGDGAGGATGAGGPPGAAGGRDRAARAAPLAAAQPAGRALWLLVPAAALAAWWLLRGRASA